MMTTPTPVHVFTRGRLVPVSLAVPLTPSAVRIGLDYALRHSGFALMEHCYARQCRLTRALEVYTDRRTALWVGLATHAPEDPPYNRADTIHHNAVADAVDTFTLLTDLGTAPSPQDLMHPAEHTVSMRVPLWPSSDYGETLEKLLGKLTRELEENDLVLYTMSKPKVTREKAARVTYLVAKVPVWGQTRNPDHYTT